MSHLKTVPYSPQQNKNQNSDNTVSPYGISGSTLKWIAVLSMLIDHIGAILIGPYTYDGGFSVLYYTCRLIGRIAFPIYCFLLVEGFLHTRHLANYCLRLALFALISEIPFDLAFRGTLFAWNYQNVFFTLLIGLLTISCMNRMEISLRHAPAVCLLGRIAVLASGMACAWYLKTDYAQTGVLSIAVFYLLRTNKLYASLGACVCLNYLSGLEISAFASVPLIQFYNGSRGAHLKYFFYLFYPLHLLILAVLARSIT